MRFKEHSAARAVRFRVSRFNPDSAQSQARDRHALPDSSQTTLTGA